jgi:hypothetical protein
MDRRIAVCALALGLSLAAAPDALAKGGNKRVQRLELTRPAGGPDADAEGVVRIERARAGDRTMLRLTHLDPRTVYEVRDAATDELLGQVRTNRRGRATFNLSRNLAKAAEAGGSDAAGGVEDVQIFDGETGDCVLEGGVVADPCEGLLAGYADYESDAGDYGSVFMESAPGFDSEFFSFTFFSSRESFAAAYYDFTRGTLFGGERPLGVESVTELAGRAFEVRDADGAVVLDDVLPELEEEECYTIQPEKPDDGGDWGDFWSGDWGDDWSGGGNGDWTDDWSGDWSGDWGFDPAGSGGADGVTKHARKDGEDDGGSPSGYTLWIEDENGELQEAGAFDQILYDVPVECPYDPGTGGGIFIGIVIVPIDGSFDFEAFLDELFGDYAGDEDLAGLFGDLLNLVR